ncbi:hypothetical protein ES705_45028 [subsurface metagenome]
MSKERSVADKKRKAEETGPFEILKDGEWYEIFAEDGEIVLKKIEDQPKVRWLQAARKYSPWEGGN